MRGLRLWLLVIAASLFFIAAPASAGGAPPAQIDAFIWQLDKDYPGANPNDSQLPIKDVYIKTHDGTDWMSTYDSHPEAISGPAALKKVMDIYQSQGIGVAAWFVPKGLDVEKQLEMAKQVIDSGVKALYADAERFVGFCQDNCSYLANNFWSRLRAERPNAVLGVIYDPRPQHWGPSATAEWLAHADVALPMCYWESYSGQVPWGDPKGCVLQAHADLAKLAPGRALQYAPILQGNTTGARIQQGMQAVEQVGATGKSVWRRGVVPAEVWNAIASYNAPSAPNVRGDVDCNGVIATSDAVQLLQHVASVASPGCLAAAGDVDCSGAIAVLDSLLIQQHIAGLPVALPPGCPAIGTPV
ncbi:MAG TPA: dockerin type I repeat-containing protein [Dehalococcoidia bacterium]|nr:dockerin type I repeat-containing protein [Dehalococcoidia bacterium]